MTHDRYVARFTRILTVCAAALPFLFGLAADSAQAKKAVNLTFKITFTDSDSTPVNSATVTNTVRLPKLTRIDGVGNITLDIDQIDTIGMGKISIWNDFISTCTMIPSSITTDEWRIQAIRDTQEIVAVFSFVVGSQDFVLVLSGFYDKTFLELDVDERLTDYTLRSRGKGRNRRCYVSGGIDVQLEID